MKLYFSSIFTNQLFSLLIGLVDGILTALTLSAGSLLKNEPVSISMSFRIAIFTALSGSFVYLIADYSEARKELIKAEKELNLTSHGEFASNNLGRAVLTQTLNEMFIISIFGFLGALIPLLANVYFHGNGWIAIVISLIALGILGGAVAKIVYGNTFRWAFCLVISGVILSIAGGILNIV